MTDPDKAQHYVSHVAPALIQHQGLSLQAKIVGTALLMHRNQKSGYCYPSELTLAGELCTSESSVRRYLKELKKAGLVDWKQRAAPRGQAKSRGNLYDLMGLLDLCGLPIVKAEAFERKPSRDRSKTIPHGFGYRSKTTPRDRSKTIPRASEIRPTEQKQKNIYNFNCSMENCNYNKDRDHDCLCPANDNGMNLTEPNEPGDRSKTTPHSARIAQIMEQRRAPDGTSFYDGEYHDSFREARSAISRAGGEGFNPESLSKAIDEHGEDRVWFQAVWFLRRLAGLKDRPRKPAALFLKAVAEDWGVSPDWPEFSRLKHGAIGVEQVAPTTNNVLDWVHWMNGFGGTIDDLPANVRDELNEAVKQGDFEILCALVPEINDLAMAGVSDDDDAIPF